MVLHTNDQGAQYLILRQNKGVFGSRRALVGWDAKQAVVSGQQLIDEQLQRDVVAYGCRRKILSSLMMDNEVSIFG